VTEQEVWRPVSSHEGYEVSNHGRVRSTKRAEPKILSPIARRGRLTYTLCQNGHATYVHATTLVAREFGAEAAGSFLPKLWEKLAAQGQTPEG
jgi:hypothetical protein